MLIYGFAIVAGGREWLRGEEESIVEVIVIVYERVGWFDHLNGWTSWK